MGRSVSGDKVVARLGERDHDQFGVHRGRISVETAKSSTSAAHPPLKAITHPNEFRDSHLQTIFLLKVLVLMETTNKSLQGIHRTDRRWPHSDQPRSAGNLASWSDPQAWVPCEILGKVSAMNRHLSDAATPQPWSAETNQGSGHEGVSVQRLVALRLLCKMSAEDAFRQSKE